MTKVEERRDMAFLDDLLEQERRAREAAPPEVSAALLARVQKDAETVQAGFERTSVPVRPTLATGVRILKQLRGALGGWPAVAGLAAVSIGGFWLGINPPQGLSDTAALLYSQDPVLLDPISGFDFDLEEI